VLGLARDGSIAFALGDVAAPIHPRSTNKLMQAAGMVSLGLDLSAEELALSAASHWGQPKHVDAVREVLSRCGLDEHALQCPPALPEDDGARRTAVEAGRQPAPVYHGCSGKHAAMLRTCVLNDWSVDGYLDPSHPLQQALHRFLEVTIDSHTAHTAVDGCGAPAWAMPLTKLASAYRGAVTADDRSSPMARVADAMRAYPDYVCGDASELTGLMRAVPGLLVKDGAESVYVAALPDGRAGAVKISDGGFRAGQAVLVESLRTLGVIDLPGVDLAQLDRWGDVPVTGHGVPVGEIRSVALL